MANKYLIEIRDRGSGKSNKLGDLTQEIAKGLDIPLKDDLYIFVSKYTSSKEKVNLRARIKPTSKPQEVTK